MQMTQLTSASLPGNPPPAPSLALSLFEGSILVFSLLLRAQVTLPTAPFHVGTNRATNNQSWGPAQHGDLSVPTSAARPTVCLSAPPSGPERTNALLRPRAAQWWKSNTCSPPPPASPPHPPPSKDRKEAIMFKHPHYEPQVSRCGSLSIKGFNRWRKREGGREREGETERGRGSARGRAKGKTGDCSFSLLIRAPTPTGFSSTKDPERKWANPAKLEGENRLRRLSRTLPSIPLPSRSIFTFSNSILRSSSLFLPFTSPLPESSLASPVEPPLSLRAAPPQSKCNRSSCLVPSVFRTHLHSSNAKHLIQTSNNNESSTGGRR